MIQNRNRQQRQQNILRDHRNKLSKTEVYNDMVFKMSFSVFSIDFVTPYTFERSIMLLWQHILALFRAYCGFMSVSPLDGRAAPTVTLDTATVTGVASGSVNKWLGIPFALPP